MRILTASGAATAALGLLLSTASAASTRAALPKPAHPATRLEGIHTSPYGKRSPAGRRRFAVPTCSTNGSDSFVGVTNAGNVSGGVQSGTVAGTNNSTCDDDSVIGGGSGNGIGNGGKALESFIGAGQTNSVTGAAAFIGAGDVNQSEGSYSFVGAGQNNDASGNGSFVGAGGYDLDSVEGSQGFPNTAIGEDSFVGAGDGNNTSGDFSFVGSGQYNTSSAMLSFVGGGDANSSSGDYSFIGSGYEDELSGSYAVIGGGFENHNLAEAGFIGSGQQNELTSAAEYGSILGGFKNTASGEYSSIDGGNGNNASGQYSLIVGGNDNKAQGAFAVVTGGADNQAQGVTSFAAGYHADAVHNGSFVWSDETSGSSLVSDGAANEFVVRASGGTYIYSSEKLTSGVKLAAGSGTWASLSDRNAKTAIVPVDDDAILAKVEALPVSTWQYKTEHSVRHVGPMAQDFYAAFGVGEDDRHITSIDEDGVALSAIKALSSESHRKDVVIAKQSGKIMNLESRLAALEARVDRLSENRTP